MLITESDLMQHKQESVVNENKDDSKGNIKLAAQRANIKLLVVTHHVGSDVTQ